MFHYGFFKPLHNLNVIDIMSTEKFISVYAEATPNPDSLKFVFSEPILKTDSSFDYDNPADASNSPLALELFKFNFIRRVFICKGFITITKDPDSLWAELIPIIRAFLKSYLGEEQTVVKNEGDNLNVSHSDNPDEPEHIRKIKAVLDQSVKPVVESDGGFIEFKSFEDGVVTLALKGSCSGCPSSMVTLKSGIENLLTRMVPEVKEVVAEAL
jgi:Fe-S cluster biogenesis protein NfuA